MAHLPLVGVPHGAPSSGIGHANPHRLRHNKYIMDYRHLQNRKSLHARIVQELGMQIEPPVQYSRAW